MAKLVTKHTTAGESGKFITCPKCQVQDRVYHFSWSALVCWSCKAEVQKLEWIEDTYRKRPTATIEQAYNWLGERGMDVSKRDIKVRGRWALARSSYDGDGWDDEVDCYDILSASTVAEAWSAIKYEDSPFIPSNDERTEIALTEIEKSWEEDGLEDFQGDGLCLISDSNEVLPFRQEHHGIVKDFLEAQLAFQMHHAFNMRKADEFLSPEARAAYENQAAATRALRDAGVFHHKYHQPGYSIWELAYMDELNDRDKPFRVMYPKQQTNDAETGGEHE